MPRTAALSPESDSGLCWAAVFNAEQCDGLSAVAGVRLWPLLSDEPTRDPGVVARVCRRSQTPAFVERPAGNALRTVRPKTPLTSPIWVPSMHAPEPVEDRVAASTRSPGKVCDFQAKLTHAGIDPGLSRVGSGCSRLPAHVRDGPALGLGRASHDAAKLSGIADIRHGVSLWVVVNKVRIGGISRAGARGDPRQGAAEVRGRSVDRRDPARGRGVAADDLKVNRQGAGGGCTRRVEGSPPSTASSRDPARRQGVGDQRGLPVAEGTGFAAELWTLSALTRYLQGAAEAAGYPRLARISRSSVWKLLQEEELKPHRVCHCLERRDPDFERRMREVPKVCRDLHLKHDPPAGPPD